MRRCALLAAAALLGLACAAPPRPVLYPNAALERAGRERAQQEIDECLALAAHDVGDARSRGEGSGLSRRTAGNAAVGAATGAAIGAAVGRSAARGAAGGAAGAATHTVAREIIHPRHQHQHRPDPVFRGYVDRCLRDRGYEVIGWRSPR